MFRRLYLAFAITGTLTFVLGWAAIIYLMVDQSDYAEKVGRPAVETAIGYGPALMTAVALQWLVAAFAHWRNRPDSN